MVMPVLSIGRRDPGRRLQGFYSAALSAELNSKALLSPYSCARSELGPTHEYKRLDCAIGSIGSGQLGRLHLNIPSKCGAGQGKKNFKLIPEAGLMLLNSCNTL
jgi:hypothetical protein